MTYVITRKCIGEVRATCIPSCPVDCIQPNDAEDWDDTRKEGAQLFIDPDVCIDCGSCETACPIGAIYDEGSLPEEYEEDLARNRDHFL